MVHHAPSPLSMGESPTSTAPLSATTRYSSIDFGHTLSMTRTGATLTMESGGTATATAKEEFLAASKLTWTILRPTIFLERVGLQRHLLKPARLDVKTILSVPFSPSGQKISQMTMAALCLEARQHWKETRPQIHISQDLLLVQVKFYLPFSIAYTFTGCSKTL